MNQPVALGRALVAQDALDAPDAYPARYGYGPLYHRVLCAGSRQQAPMLLLHGFSGDRRSWQDFATAWRKGPVGADRRTGSRPPAPLRLVALDLPGHGRSPRPPDPSAGGMDGVVAAVLATMDALGLAEAHLLGYSMGGRVALSLALAAPHRVASLSLIGASPGIADPSERAARAAADDALAARLEAAGLPAFVDEWMAQPLFASQARLHPSILARERRRRLEQSPPGLAQSLRLLGTGRMPPLWERLSLLAMPCLCLAGAEDAKFLAIGRAMAGRSARITVRAVPGAGHAAQLERPDWVADCIGDFLADCGDEVAGGFAGDHSAGARRLTS